MSRADDDSDDEGLEGLGSFRSMFREMPDEEPPQRGFAELMAAARVKADEMAKPSLWERFLQTMRRPQMMALATIMILIGGAVFISQRKSEMDASPTATQSYEEKAATPTAETIATGAAGSAAAVELDGDTKKDSPGDDLVGAPAPEPTSDRGGEDLRAKGEAEAPKQQGPRKAVAPSKDPVASTPPKASKSAPKKPSLGGVKSTSSDSELLESGIDASPRGIADETKASEGNVVTRPGTGAAAATSTPSTPTVKQLHEQARTAAAAGDCAKVRTLAKQIAAKDAPFYRANIAPDAALASCLK